ncbi:MAG TPA: phosphoglucosamine mutase [bacterium]|nr:phosphoglucosamine mutase [bacterium]
MADSRLVISVSGIRGIAFDPLSPDVCCRFAAALATILGQGTYVVGRDTRLSGEMLESAVISGLGATGSRVVDLGVATTPTIQLAVEHHRAQGGIAITASHNPAEWNALKLISRAGTFLEKPDVDRVIDVFNSGKLAYSAFDRAGRLERDPEAGQRHLEQVLRLGYLDLPGLRSRRLRVAIDCVNGAASIVIPDLVRRLGCQLSALSCEPTGIFGRNPEPLAQNLAGLSDLVRRERADLGLAFDPDGDRLAIVDDRGEAIGEDLTLAISADLVLTHRPGPVVTNLSTSMVVEDVAKRHGVPCYRSPIGEINVVSKMKQVGSPIGGEGNGGVILPEIHYGRDALVGTALVLQAVAASGTRLSQMMVKYPKYVIVKEKVSSGSEPGSQEFADRVRGLFPGSQLNLDDGLRVDLGGRWLHIRRSGTEPVIRLIAEAAGIDEARALIAKGRSLLD